MIDRIIEFFGKEKKISADYLVVGMSDDKTRIGISIVNGKKIYFITLYHDSALRLKKNLEELIEEMCGKWY